MITFECTVTRESLRALQKMQRDTGRAYARAGAISARNMRGQLRKALRGGGGVYGIPKFPPRSSTTVAWHGRGRLFGIFAEPARIVMYKRSNAWTIGWPDKMSDWLAEKLQTAQTRDFSKAERAFMHRREIPIPPHYDRPERDIYNPFQRHIEEVFPEMVEKLVKKFI